MSPFPVNLENFRLLFYHVSFVSPRISPPFLGPQLHVCKTIWYYPTIPDALFSKITLSLFFSLDNFYSLLKEFTNFSAVIFLLLNTSNEILTSNITLFSSRNSNNSRNCSWFCFKVHLWLVQLICLSFCLPLSFFYW